MVIFYAIPSVLDKKLFFCESMDDLERLDKVKYKKSLKFNIQKVN